MKILSNKKYEKFQQDMVNLQLDLNDAMEDNKTLEAQVSSLLKMNKELEEANIDKYNKCYEQSKEIKRLKQLLTRNGINYKKEDKNGKGN